MATKRKRRHEASPPGDHIREKFDFGDFAKSNSNFATAEKRKPRRQAFPPGDHIREEIEYRGWTQGDLATIMGRPLQVVNEIINGKKAITARTAYELEAALGPSAETWMNLETSWQLYRAARPDPEIAVRAKQHMRGRSAKA
jgi:addiction module HigA family antidote